jgi:hypothetical protein
VLVVAPLAGGALIHIMGPDLTFQFIGIATLAIGVAGIVLQRVLWGIRESHGTVLKEHV